MTATLAAVLMVALPLQQSAAVEVSMEHRSWPTPTVCDACVNLQFGEISMTLPLALIGRIFVSGSEASALHLLAPDATDGKNSTVFLSVKREAYIGKYQAVGLRSANNIGSEAFFDLLGVPAQKGSPYRAIRRIEGIDAAEHYFKTSKGALHAYWIQSAPERSQYLHIVVDGSDTLYTVTGTFTPQFYGALLGGMSVRPMP